MQRNKNVSVKNSFTHRIKNLIILLTDPTMSQSVPNALCIVKTLNEWPWYTNMNNEMDTAITYDEHQ